mgnify:CR=1 FL=1
MMSIASAVVVALLTYASIGAREGEYRRAIAEKILSSAHQGMSVAVEASIELSWRAFVVSAPFAAFILQLMVYGAWSAAFKLVGGKRGFVAALAVIATSTVLLGLFALRVVFYVGEIPPEQPFLYLLLNASLAALKYRSVKADTT